MWCRSNHTNLQARHPNEEVYDIEPRAEYVTVGYAYTPRSATIFVLWLCCDGL